MMPTSNLPRVLFTCVCSAHVPVMESRDLVSKVSGLVSVSKATGLQTLNIAKEWFSKPSIFQ